MNIDISIQLIVFVILNKYLIYGSSSQCSDNGASYNVGQQKEQHTNPCRICTCITEQGNPRSACHDKNCEDLDKTKAQQLLCYNDFKCKG